MKKISTLLIANRGEIACRIIQTCRAMGIRTVTVSTAQDESLPHSYLSDRSVLLEGEALADTYLNQKQLIAIAKEVGADAIHPGYGFLSENASFAKAVEKAGLIFVGPDSATIALMGDKKAARQAMEKIHIPLIPGYHGNAQDTATLAKEAKKIGYPVLIKAAAGGGGKGMRVVEGEKALAESIRSARSEAMSAFGDDRILLEKYLVRPRHIEVQVFSDSHGNHLHLFERDCSIQRRHQKIVEESPAPSLPEKLRTDICATAVRITSHINYRGAGTVEFILDESGEFYFLEMNTRLQVEHPVTEMVTGLDLVRLQIEVAEGKKLVLAQRNIAQRGHAVEVRLYAEDPDNNFLPTTGRIERIGQPSAFHVRFENGYAEGNSVTVSYDPMLAKLAAWGEDRETAIARLRSALADVWFAGVKTNRDYLMRILKNPTFIKGQVSTKFVEQHAKALAPIEPASDALALYAAAYLLNPSHGTASVHVSGAVTKSEHSAWTDTKLAGFRNA